MSDECDSLAAICFSSPALLTPGLADAAYDRQFADIMQART